MAILATSGAANAQPPRNDNPFYEDWSRLPYGAPPFDRIRSEHYMPAIQQGVSEHSAEIERIANNRARPTFANTIEALETSGRTLGQAAGVFYNLTSSDNTETLQGIQREATPIFARHQNELFLNQALWRRIDDLYQRRESLRLTPEQNRVLWRYHLDFVRAGAGLDEAGRTRLAAINERLAALYTQFDQNLLADTAGWTLTLNGERDLAGLPQALREAALQQGRALGREGQYVVTLQRPSVEPFLTFSSRRDLREQAFRAWAMRGQNGNEYDNRALIREVLQLRAEKARLLGYETFAEYVLADRMARSPDRAYDLMMEVWRPAVARAGEERAQLQAMIDRENGGFQLEAWDWRYYAERVRAAQYNVSDEETRPYFQLDRMIDGVFATANRLFGLTFTELDDFPVYHPDVRAFEVRRNNRVIGLYLLDPYARPTKQSGAWMNAFQVQQRAGGRRIPVVVNCLNYNKGEPGQPVLIGWDDAETLFHEFGHALHGLLSDVTYPRVSGTDVARDYVEFPSQVMEHWFASNETLSRYAVHAQTGQPMPPELIARVQAAANFNQGWATVEFLSSALVDMDLHMQRSFPADFDVVAFETSALQRIGMPREIIMRHRTPHFGHIFSGDGYSAGYYGYLWAEVLDADAYDAFTETGNVFDPATAERFREYIFSAGNLREPMEAYVLFRGREPTTEPLLRNRGLAPANAN